MPMVKVSGRHARGRRSHQ